MNLTEFKSFLDHYRLFHNATSELYDLGFDLIEGKYPITGHADNMLYTAIKSVWGEKGLDWVIWFIFENDWGEKEYGAWDSDGTPICYSVESLYEYLQKEHRPLTYKERISWFINNYYETGMELENLLESFKDKDLDNFEWNGEFMSFPRFKVEI